MQEKKFIKVVQDKLLQHKTFKKIGKDPIPKYNLK